jgi:hypothetical protein
MIRQATFPPFSGVIRRRPVCSSSAMDVSVQGEVWLGWRHDPDRIVFPTFSWGNGQTLVGDGPLNSWHSG